MTLAAGSRVGPYEILSAVGAGGMGEVYRARDPRLNRSVAIKILPPAFAHDADRVARFQREAQVLATLNHPNIAQIYGVEEIAGSASAIVLEFVDGPTLAMRIDQGPLPPAEALRIARQIAEALEGAHEKGVIHRDLKPANIKLREDGTIKVLDFGLAKVFDRGSGVEQVSPDLATITSPALGTSAGIILGTAAYMSPEQARGQAVDRGSDLWSFGCVLFEMVSGQRAFAGHDVSETIAEIIKGEPDWKALPPLPPSALRLLRRCLVKDRRSRLADASAARLEIEDAIGSSAVVNVEAHHDRPPRSFLPWAIAAGVVLVAVAVPFLPASRSAPAPLTPVRMTVEAAPGVALTTLPGPAAAISPDGHALAFVAQPSTPGAGSQIYYRRLDQLTAQPIAGTSGAINPFFSPDGRWIGFFADTKLKKISVTGGSAVVLADASNGRGGSWGDDDTIVYTPDIASGVWRVPASGGEAVRLVAPGPGEMTIRWPQMLPGSRAFLYMSNPSFLGYEDSTTYVQPLSGGPRKVLHRGGYHGRYLPSGHFAFLHEGTLFAAPLDLDQLTLAGAPVPVMQDVAGSPFWTGGAQLSVASNGTALYVPTGGDAAPIQWLDSYGAISTLYPTPTSWTDPAFSPDGRRVAFSVFDGKQLDVWIYEWERQALARLTVDSADDARPVWSPDGRWIAFGSTRGGVGTYDVYVQRTDGSGVVQRLTEGLTAFPQSWHPSGRYLTGVRVDPKTSFDSFLLTLTETATGWQSEQQKPLFASPASEIEAAFSPDGRWLSYSSNATGRFEVYVAPFDRPGGPWQVSNNGGVWPTWSRARPELFFVAPDQRFMAAAYRAEGETFVASAPLTWAQPRMRPRGPLGTKSYTLHPDGRRIGLTVASESSIENKVVFVFNFLDELRRLAPVQ